MNLNQISQKLAEVGSPTPGLDGRLLVSLVTGLTPDRVLAGDWQLDETQKQHLGNLIAARAQTPVAYLRGRVEFFGLDFVVDDRVLVPRPESEDLVGLALELGPHRAVYDIGCGSGCLGLAYQSQQARPTRLHLIDSSPPAVTVAAENARRLGLAAETRIRAVAELEPQDWEDDSLVLANLPYLDQKQQADHYRHCPELAAEPPEALFAGRKGLAVYRQLWPRLGDKPKHLIIEADWSQRARLIAQGARHGWGLIGWRGLALAFSRPKPSPREF